jgi:pimeloyl-ACP methyl ester carboxylesterase
MMKLLWLLALVSVASPVLSWGSVECEKNEAPLGGGFCIARAERGTSHDVLYYFHGSGGSEKNWLDETYYTAQLRQEWKETGAQPPIVVSVSFGPNWVLAEKNAAPTSGLFEYFTRVFLPKIEGRLGGVTGRRLLVGESMGGFNAIQMALKTRLFTKVAALCAPVTDITPFASTSEVEAYIARTRADRRSVYEIIQLGRAFFPTLADWVRSAPLNLAAAAELEGAPEL